MYMCDSPWQHGSTCWCSLALIRCPDHCYNGLSAPPALQLWLSCQPNKLQLNQACLLGPLPFTYTRAHTHTHTLQEGLAAYKPWQPVNNPHHYTQHDQPISDTAYMTHIPTLVHIVVVVVHCVMHILGLLPLFKHVQTWRKKIFKLYWNVQIQNLRPLAQITQRPIMLLQKHLE